MTRRDRLLIPLLALLPLLLYGFKGYRGQDFSFHVTSWMELHDAWQAHQWCLGWSRFAQYGFGEPRFCFYPPLSLLIGAALDFVMPARFVPGVIAWLVLTLSGFSMYLAAKAFLPRNRHLPAALLYMFNPYLTLTILMRFAVAEAWMQALLPVTFVYFYLSVIRGRRRANVPFGILMALGWLTNIPGAIALFYALSLVTLVLAGMQRSWRPLFQMAGAQTLAFLLAGFRLVPTLLEKGWVSSQALLLYDFRYNLQFEHRRPHLILLLCGIDTLAGSILVLLALRQYSPGFRRWSPLAVSLAVLAGTAVFLQLPLSIPVWLLLPQFRFIAFPFRFLPLLSLAGVLLLCLPQVRRPLRTTAAVLSVLLALLPISGFAHAMSYESFPSLSAAIQIWRTGFEGVREYVPVQVPPGVSLPSSERSLHGSDSFASSACRPVLLRGSPNQRVVASQAPLPCVLVLKTFYYPFWKATLEDGSAVPIRFNPRGLLLVTLPAGPHTITFDFKPATPARTISAVVSALTLLLALVFGAVWPPGLDWLHGRRDALQQAWLR